MMALRQGIDWSVAAGRALALVAIAALCACASSGAHKPGKIEILEDGGFTITEQTRFGGGVRSDFEQALELIDAGESEAGIALLEKVVAEAPYATAAHINLGIAYRLTEQYEKAEASLLQALELNRRHPVAHNELGIVYRKTGRFAEAKASYERALSIAPDFHFARRNLAILCDVYLGDLECALENYKLYSESVPDDDKAAIWIADLQNRLGK